MRIALSTATVAFGATTAVLTIVAAVLQSPEAGIAAALVAAVAWYLEHRAAGRTQAALEERALRAERTLAELQDHARPRTVDATLRADMVDTLKRMRPEGPIDVAYVTEGTEPYELTKTLVRILDEAGWNVGRPDGGPAGGAPIVGLMVRVSPAEDPPARALALVSVLNAAGLPATMQRHHSTPAGRVTLTIGVKP